MGSKRRFITQAAYAKHRGVSAPYVSKLVKQRVIDLVEGLIDVEAADAILTARSQPGRAFRRQMVGFDPEIDDAEKLEADIEEEQQIRLKKARAKKPQPIAEEDTEPSRGHKHRGEETEGLANQLLRAKLKLESEKGRIAELNRKKREGELIERADVEQAAFKRAAAERDALMNFPSRYAADMAAELGLKQRELYDVLGKYIRKHLADRSRSSVADKDE